MGSIKNLLVYVTPDKKFNAECSLLAKVQIDNALNLGQKDDIILVTNFPYEYNGVESIIVTNDNYCAVRPRSIKTSIISHLIDQGIVEKGKIYWNHDFDAFQNNLIEESELGLEAVDIGLTDYGWKSRWCMGSFFFKDNAKDIFKLTKEIIFKDVEDEAAMTELTEKNINNINERTRRLNITYNYGMKRIDKNYKIATKPVKVLHFHPSKPRLLDIFMYGKSEIGIPLMSDRLREIFSHHGIK